MVEGTHALMRNNVPWAHNTWSLSVSVNAIAAPSTNNAAAAINQIVEDATQCKFESTNNAQDEIVLLNIVQV